jgi:maleylpyruvate isomerase
VTADPLVLAPEVDRATDRLLRTAAALDGDGALRVPSLLPGWTRGHVLAHLARNADGLVNLLTWARTGTPTPQYESQARRDADIEAGAPRPLAEHLTDLRESGDRFARAVSVMPPDAWATVVRWRSGALRPATAIVWGRLQELEVHHLDLAAGYQGEDWPEGFAHRLLHDVVAKFKALPEPPALILRATDLGHELTIGDQRRAPTVSGPAHALAAWLTGRSDSEKLTVSPAQKLANPPQWI